MGSVIGEVTPLALGVALSPFPVVPAVLLLFTPRAKATAGAFLAGCRVGGRDPRGDRALAGVASAGACVQASVLSFPPRHCRTAASTRTTPSTNLVHDTQVDVPSSSPYRRRTRRAPASTVALPLVLRLVVGEGVLTPLGRARIWLETHNVTVTALVLALIGVMLLVEGVVGLRAGPARGDCVRELIVVIPLAGPPHLTPRAGRAPGAGGPAPARSSPPRRTWRVPRRSGSPRPSCGLGHGVHARSARPLEGP